MAGRESFLASRSVKKALRRRICDKLLRQLEAYFGACLPQFFYSLLAPLPLFVLLFPIS